jgi:hypothetical protein
MLAESADFMLMRGGLSGNALALHGKQGADLGGKFGVATKNLRGYGKTRAETAGYPRKNRGGICNTCADTAGYP